jgi:hypothetical protein
MSLEKKPQISPLRYPGFPVAQEIRVRSGRDDKFVWER